MAKRKRPAPELPLFDLPLHPEADPEPVAESSEPEPATETAETTETEAEPERASSELAAAEREGPDGGKPDQARLFSPAEEAEPETPEASAASAPFVERLQAGLADLVVHVLMLAVAVAAAYRLGVHVTLEYWPPFATLALVFSFLYWMIPIAFWGQTPGMAWVGHLARGLGDEPLTFQQTFLRWLGALLTCGLAGLPLLLALGGSSFSDRLSRSKTVLV